MRTAIALAMLAIGAPAAAGPGLTLPRGAVNASLTVEVNASKGAFGSPVSIAPDVGYGVTDTITIAVIHSTFATTGFRGGAGAGVCVADSCPRIYDNAGVEGVVAVARGTIDAAITGAALVTSFDRGWVAAKLGAKLRVTTGPWTFASAPSVVIAITDRDGDPPHRDRLFVPLVALVQVATTPVSLGLGTGFKAPLDDVGDGYEIAAGALVQVAVAPGFVTGASWVHGKILGGDAAVPPGTSGLDFRAIQVWLSVTR